MSEKYDLLVHPFVPKFLYSSYGGGGYFILFTGLECIPHTARVHLNTDKVLSPNYCYNNSSKSHTNFVSVQQLLTDAESCKISEFSDHLSIVFLFSL